MDDLVEVIDLEVTTVAGKSLYTLRAHEGDTMAPAKGICIRFGPKTVQGRTLPSRVVTITDDKIVEVSQETRLEPRIRLSVQMAIDRDKAEIQRLAEKLGVGGPS